MDGGIGFRADEFDGSTNLFIGGTGNTSSGSMVFDLPLVDIRFSLFESNASEMIPSAGDRIRAADFPTSGLGSLANNSSSSGGTEPIGVFRTLNQRLVAADLIGDFDLDGDASGADFLLWQRGGSPSPISPKDLIDWRENHGVTDDLQSISSRTIPEPTSATLGMLALLVTMLRLRVRTKHGCSWS